ncbi:MULTISPECIES: efflux transporter outer membrane subunit [unclassified Sphingomonas]|uniref:efflux transporter outer membrane subunit n=1 Tax=Sphingomonas TaxID=13687 RepID=UPI00095C7246|nr:MULTISPECIES: efflux transporter outer membrane subunit [unclassified Sphingomonas]MBN8812823.1 efflux transporter outer membrane subunit [Sphingomonas sp.]OJY51245.1 MAG: transporter [Sphingomonas sp. 67-41]
MKRAVLTLLLGTALAGCSMEPKYARPEAPVPPGWPAGDAYLKADEAALPSVTWQDILKDPRLRKLIEQALANNRDLRVAAANIAAARAQYRIQRADRIPELDAGAGATVAHGSSTGAVTTGGTRTNFSGNVSIPAFELDLFGRVASLTHAQQDRWFATEAAARATRLTLIGDIAAAWLNHAADASLLKIAEDTAANAERAVALTDRRLKGGIAPRTDLAQAQQILATAQSDVATQKTALAQDVNALRLLVGADIDAAQLSAAIEEAAPTVAELPAGVDSGVLLRRPDVVQAEYTLRAANAQIGAARAALFPRISLTGLLGFASNALTGLFSGNGFNWSGGASASYPIFNAGAGRAGVQLSEAQRDAALATYEKSIQTAFREVADALARRGTIADQLKANRNNLAAAQDSYRLAEARYRGGIDNFLANLVAQRSYYTAQRGLVNTRLVEATNLVTLYRTLGGDSLLTVTPSGPRPAAP